MFAKTVTYNSQNYASILGSDLQQNQKDIYWFMYKPTDCFNRIIDCITDKGIEANDTVYYLYIEVMGQLQCILYDITEPK